MSDFGVQGGSSGWGSEVTGESAELIAESDSGVDNDALLFIDDDSGGKSGGDSGGDAGGDSKGNSNQQQRGGQTVDDDNADVNGLSFPSLNADIKAVLTSLGRDQAIVSSEVTTLTSEQIDKFQDEKSTQFTKNINKLAKMRASAEKAEFWSEVAKIGGYTAAVSMILVGAFVPALAVAGTCMLVVMIMNDTGATQDMMDAMGPVAGTIVLASAIILLSIATGGVAGLTMFTTLGTGLLVSQENLENYGVDSQTAMWVSLGVGIGASLVCGVGAARMASKGATVAASTGQGGAKAGTSTAATTANTGAKASSSGGQTAAKSGTQAASSKTGSQAAKSGAQAAGSTDDVARSASNASDATGVMDDASQAASDVSEAAEEVARHGKEVTQQVSKGRLEKLLEGRLEQYMQRKLMEISSNAGATGINANSLARLSAYSTITLGVVEMFTGALGAVTTVFNYETSVYKADAELSDAIHEYASEKEDAWAAMYSQVADSFNTQVSTTSDIIETYHEATQGHQQFSV